MDTFSRGSYFACDFPVKALSNPLLKYAACAYAAKHLSRVKGARTFSAISWRRRSTKVWPDAEKVNWARCGAKYYAKAISLLIKALPQGHKATIVHNSGTGLSYWQSNGSSDTDREQVFEDELCSTSFDNVLAATTILCNYEFIDASRTAWSQHLSGTKSLLDIGVLSTSRAYEPPFKPSKARKASFWNFARQDFLEACKLA